MVDGGKRLWNNADDRRREVTGADYIGKVERMARRSFCLAGDEVAVPAVGQS